MNNIQIIFPAGNYDNCDAYEAVLTYVSNKQFVSGYGIPLPVTRNSSIISFYKAEATSKHISSRYIWHFQITFKEKLKDTSSLLFLGNQIAFSFAYQYQVIYGVDTDTDHTHLHFAVNAYSYNPESKPLTKEMMDLYVNQISDLIKSTYPYYDVEPIWK